MKAQNLPHYGVKHGYTRKGKMVCIREEIKNADTGVTIPAEFEHFVSISKAKHYMRTGER